MRVITLLLDNFLTRPIDAIFIVLLLLCFMMMQDIRFGHLPLTPLVLKHTVARILNTTILLSPVKMHCKGYSFWELEFISVALATVQCHALI